MNSLLRAKAVRLRVKNRLSYTAIKKKLGVPKSTLSYWLRDFPLSESEIILLKRAGWTKSEASRERYRETMRKKKEATLEELLCNSRNEFRFLPTIALKTAGIALYLAEGDKKNLHRIALANTDPALIIFFVNWLRKFMAIPQRDIKIQLHLYENMDIAKEERFWQNTVRLPSRQFYKIQVRKITKNSFMYREGFRHGTCSIFVLGVKRKAELMMAGRALMEKLNMGV